MLLFFSHYRNIQFQMTTFGLRMHFSGKALARACKVLNLFPVLQTTK